MPNGGSNIESSLLPVFLAPSAYDCDFECKCTCNWVNDVSTKFNWTVTRGSTSSANTGPGTDHTTGTALGSYIYIETSIPARPNDTARLISPDLIVADQESCFRFYYHMFGSDIYRLNVYSQISTFTSGRKTFSSRSSFSRWQSGQSTLAKRRQSSESSLTGDDHFRQPFSSGQSMVAWTSLITWERGTGHRFTLSISGRGHSRQKFRGWYQRGRFSVQPRTLSSIEYVSRSVSTHRALNIL